MLATEFSFLASKVSSLGSMPPTLYCFLVALMGDWRKAMEKDFKGNEDALLAISFDVHPSSHCCHFPALTWQ